MNSTTINVVISGSSAISSAGAGLEPVLAVIRECRSVLTPVPDELAGFSGQLWGRAGFFKASEYMPPLKARKMDRASQFATAATGMALKDAGIELSMLDPERVGIALGCGFGGVGNSAEFLSGYFSGGVDGLSPMLFPNTVSNAPASNASIEHGLKGPNVTLVQRFCSAESAFMMACRFIEEGRADIMVTGGIDDLIPLMMSGFKALGQLSRYAHSFGEGCGILILESADHARRRGARIRAAVGDIRTIGLLPEGQEREGGRYLLGDCSGIALIGISGTTVETSSLMEQLPAAVTRLETGPLIGRSLGMGGIAMAALVASLRENEQGLHLASSPEGPYFSIRFREGAPV
jgi:3-oxoacyl-[acyl-carrier-protein] synthase II